MVLTIIKCVAALAAFVIGFVGIVFETKEEVKGNKSQLNRRLSKAGRLCVALLIISAVVSIVAELLERSSAEASKQLAAAEAARRQDVLLDELARARNPIGKIAVGVGIRYASDEYPWSRLIGKHDLPEQCDCYVRLKRKGEIMLDMKVLLKRPLASPSGENDVRPNLAVPGKTIIVNTVYYEQETLYLAPNFASTLDLDECDVLVYFVNQGGYLVKPSGKGVVLTLDFPESAAAPVWVDRITLSVAGGRKLDVPLKRDPKERVLYTGSIKDRSRWR